MYIINNFNPHIAIYAAAFVPPAFTFRSIYSYCYNIFPAQCYKICNVIIKARVTALMSSHIILIYIQSAIAVYSIKVNINAFVCKAFIRFEPFPIPCDSAFKTATRKQPVAYTLHFWNFPHLFACGIFKAIFALCDKIMRQVYTSPL